MEDLSTIAWEAKKNLVSSVNNAASRSRAAFYVITLTSLFYILGMFNMDLSWERHLNFKNKNRVSFGFDHGIFPNDEGVLAALEDKIQYTKLSDNQKELYKAYISQMPRFFGDEFFKRLQTNIPILGVRVFASDITLLGSLALVIFSTWSFFCVRRESHLVGQIRSEFDQSQNADLKLFLYQGTINENLFLTATKNDTVNNTQNKLARYVFTLVTVLPPLTILFSTILTMYQTYQTVIQSHVFEIIVLILISFSCFLYTTYQSILILQWFKESETHLAHMQNLVPDNQKSNN